MKVVYTMILWLLLFSVFLVVLSPYFPGTSEIKPSENDPITGEENLRSYEGAADAIGIVKGMFLSWETLAIFGAIFGATGLFAKFAGGSINIALLLGISIFIATLLSIWRFVGDTVSNLNYTNNPTVNTIFIIVNICLGVLVVFTIVDLLTGQQGTEG